MNWQQILGVLILAQSFLSLVRIVVMFILDVPYPNKDLEDKIILVLNQLFGAHLFPLWITLGVWLIV